MPIPEDPQVADAHEQHRKLIQELIERLLQEAPSLPGALSVEVRPRSLADLSDRERRGAGRRLGPPLPEVQSGAAQQSQAADSDQGRPAAAPQRLAGQRGLSQEVLDARHDT